jgi:S1-C subfamily serine protease
MHPTPRFPAAPGFLLWLACSTALLTAAEQNSGNPPAEKAAPPSAATAIPASAIVSEATSAAIENSVVKIFSTIRRPDVFKPWAKNAPSEASGTGIIIEGKRILTNAHVVSYASQVQVQANQSGTKVSATIEAIAQGIDLAVLKVEDESLFDGRPPVPRANALPDVKEAVMAYGYPTGGTNLSITKGIVSRIDFTPYNLGTSGLRIQIDAAINSGNSGGPAVSGDKMIGLAFSRLGNAQNIGYIIPNEEIELFLADVADGRYEGKPTIFDEVQTLENPALRAFLKLDKAATGVVVDEPFSNEPGYPLKKWDVITKIGDTTIDDQGMVKPARVPRVIFRYLVQKSGKNGTVPLTVIRGGQEIKVELPTLTDRPLVVADLRGTYPSYFVFGPLVFSAATAQFAGSYEGSAAAVAALNVIGNPIMRRRGDKPAFAGEQLVVVSSPFFPHKLAKGYYNPIGRVVETINGKRVNHLNHLVELLRDAKDEFITFEFAGRSAPAIVLPRQECLAATEDILNDNGVRSQGSADTMAVWNKGGAKATQ